jgi:hypothetical protein
MSSKTEAGARRLIAEIYRATDRRLQRWCTLSDVCERTGVDEQAVEFATSKGWVNLEPKVDPHSVALLDAGRRLVE